MMIAIDTMILAWAFRESAANRGNQEKQREDQERARRFVKDLHDDKKCVKVLSSITLAEALIPVAPEKRVAFVQAIEESFLIAPMDVRSSVIAAALYKDHQHLRAAGKVGERTAYRADTLIVASLKAFGVKVFFTHDDRCRKIASTVMEARPIPAVSGDLFNQ